MNSKQALALVSLQCGKNFLKSERIAKLFMPSIYRAIRRAAISRKPSKSCDYKRFERYVKIYDIIFDVNMVQMIIKNNLEEDGFNVVVRDRDFYNSTAQYIMIISWGN